MLKKIQLLLLLVSSLNFAWSQTFQNDWIKYNQTYVKFKVAEDGIYRISRDVLVAKNNGFVTVNPKNIQVFSRGVEQAIYVYGENDFSFDSGDYIELYCKKNDGFLDSLMYDNPDEQNNPFYSQINDTISYFVTWENSPTIKKRFSNYSSNNFSSYNPITSVVQQKLYSYNNKFYWGQRISNYSSGKGWFDSNDFVYGQPTTKTIDVSNRINTSNVEVQYSVCGAPNSDLYSYLEHHLKIKYNSNEYADESFSGYNGVKNHFNILASSISNDAIDLEFSSNYNQNNQVDRNVIAYINVSYDRNLDFNNETHFDFFVNSSSANRQINLTNFSGNQPVIYNLTNQERTVALLDGSTLNAIINTSPQASEIVVSITETIKTVSKVENVNFFNFNNLQTAPDYIIVYNQKLESSVNSYSIYRASQGYTVLKAEISDLYNQFAYGIEKHPLAIRNLIKFLKTNYQTPSFLFMVGKSISSAVIRNNVSAFNNCLVPTMGNPPSDVLITSNIDQLGLEPLVNTGRLAARSNIEVEDYLKKVKDYESSIDGIWKKNAIHFGGGSTTYEQSTFANYLNEYRLIYQDTLLGGQVTTFLKSSSDPIQISVSDSVAFLIDEGVSLITFFGHGSTSGFDQNIDEPENYNNFSKYPLILANSCLSGDIHQNTTNQVISEKWVLIPNKGSIGFLSSSDLGYASQLHNLSREFYKKLSYENYGSSIGEIIKESLRSYSNSNPTSLMVKKTVFDNTFHGDPAIIINAFEKPDLKIENSGLSFSPNPITSESDSFKINLTYFNIGKAFVDSFLISIERFYPDGHSDFKTVVREGCFYGDQVSINLFVDPINGVGVNRIKIRLDYLNQIDERYETNNEIEIEFIINSDDLIPIYPYQYAVVPSSNQKLVASSGDPFADNFTAVFEIDTSDAFNSPLFLSESIITNGGITEWDLPFQLMDSTVYFWRVTKQGTNRWRGSSFRYINSQRGWSQAHHFQFDEDSYQFINYKKPERKFEFITTPKTLLCKNIGSVSVSRVQEVGFWLDGVGDQNSCGAVSSFNVVVIDTLSLEPWTSDRFDYGHRDYPKCYSRTRPDLYFQFSTSDSLSMENFANLINIVPEGYHILIYSVWNGNFSALPEHTKQAFELLNPVSQIRSISNNKPYILYAQKGKPSSAVEVIGASTTDEISLEVYLNTNFDYGNIFSTPIGPASEWQSFHWRYNQNIDQKNTEIKILGLDALGHQQVLIDHLTKDSLDVLDLSSRIDANTYPYLQLQMYCKDSIQKIPTQIKSWSLLFQEVPETAIEPEGGYYFYKDTVNQGEEIVFAISTKNISSYDMDSLKVSCFVKNNQNQVAMIKSKKLKMHPSQDIITDTVAFNTINSRELNSIWFEFNSLDSVTGMYDQMEQYHFNNIAIKYFYVLTDKINPLLNVTFDGIHIMDGDIVSPKPEIVIRLKDENQYLAMEDPDLVSIYLKRPNSDTEEKVGIKDSLLNQQLYWTPSQLPENVAELLFTPSNLEDGIYTLRVGATDASSNESGKFDYRISFQVINKSTISEVLNYPNPFSTSTRFVFTLTGSELPEELVVQIMTISGKVVKEIDLSKESSLHIGRNITDYAWDGRDEYGDLLANGVYFYRVLIKTNHQEVEIQSTSASKFFKHGIGKMYIVR